MANDVLVSVIMNCYNSSQDLEACLQSLKAQTYAHFEVIFFDNCSTDASASIAKTFDARLKYYLSDQHVPLGCARNLALEHAQGELIAFLDCDDLWEPDKLRKQVALFAQDPQVGLVTCDTMLLQDGKIVGRVFQTSQPARGYVFRELLQRQWISMSSAMVRRTALASLTKTSAWNGGWFDETLNVCEEADVFYRISAKWKLDYVDQPLTTWRIHTRNTTFAKYGLFATETRKILEKLRQLMPNFSVEYADLVELLTERANFQEAVDLWHRGFGKAARALLGQHKLKSPKTKLFWLCTFLPGSWFDLLAKVYFALPKFLRRG